MAFYLVDKPTGISSFDVIRAFRRQLHIRRVGHTGTLDPLASGLLIVATHTSTKLIPYCMLHDKVYEVSIRLDGMSETDDGEGPITPLKQSIIPSLSDIQNSIRKSFLGLCQQTPPRYSSVKIDGVRSYTRARSGEDFSIRPRTVCIHAFDIISYAFPYLHARIHVSSGTYIRSIARDIGTHLTGGGYVSSLRRTHIAHLSVDDDSRVDLNDLERALPISYERIFPNFGMLQLPDVSTLGRLQQGKQGVYLPNISAGTYFVRYYDDDMGLVTIDAHGHVEVLRNNV